MNSLEELFCQIDDFCNIFEPLWQAKLLGQGLKHRQRRRALSLSEVMTILALLPSAVLPQFQAFL